MERRKVLAHIVILVVLLSSLYTPVTTEAGEARTEISQQYNNFDKNGDPIDTFYPNEERVYNVNFSISSEESGSDNYTVVLDVPTEPMDQMFYGWYEQRVKVGKPEGASEVRHVQNKDGSWQVEVDFPSLYGGTIFSFPVIVEYGDAANDGWSVPENYKHTVKATLYDSNGEIVKKSDGLSFYTKYDKPETEVRLAGGNEVFLGFEDEDGNIVEGTESNYARFLVGFDHSNINRLRAFGQYDIAVHLPDGAAFDPDLVVDGKKVNEGWVLDEKSQMIERTTDFMGRTLPDTTDDETPAFYLSFPDKEKGDTSTVRADVTYHPEDKKIYEPDPYTDSDDETFSFDSKPINSVFTKTALRNHRHIVILDDTLAKTRGEYYKLAVNNPSKTAKLTDVVVTDFKKQDGSLSLDPRMEFKRLGIDKNMVEYIERVIFYTGSDGEKMIEKNMENAESGSGSHWSTKFIEVPDGTKGVAYELKDIPPETSVNIYLQAAFSNPKQVSYDSVEPKNNQMWNEANVEFRLDSGGKVSEPIRATSSDYINLEEFNQELEFRKGYQSGSKRLGDTFVIRPSISANISSATPLTNIRMIGLLPPGADPVEDDLIGGYSASKVERSELVYDYKGTGRTAIVAYLDDVPAGEAFDMYLSGINMNTIVNNLSEFGVNTADVYLTFDQLDDPDIEFEPLVDDKLGINTDSVSSDKILKVEEPYQYVPIKELTANHYVQVSTAPHWSKDSAKLGMGVKSMYRLDVANYLNSAVDDLVLYDVLPHKGDKNIVKESTGEYEDRGSEYTVSLKSPIDTPEGFKTYYTTEEPLEDPGDSVKAGYWKESLDDYEDVKAVKIVMDEGKSLRPKERVTIDMDVTVPGFFRYSKSAYNSFAISTNNRTFVESNKTELYTYDEIDIPVTKIWDGEEKEQITVRVMNRENVAREKVITREDDWKYTFEGLPLYDKRGYYISYKVTEDRVPGYTTSIERRFGHGYFITNSQASEIEVSKVWVGEEQEYITVHLKADGEVVNTATLDRAGGWRHVFTDLEGVNSETGEPITYTVEEEKIEAYNDVVTGNAEDGFIITNTQKAVLGFDYVRILTAEASEGLPVSLKVDAHWAADDVYEKFGDEPFTIVLSEMDKDGEAQEVARKTVTINDTKEEINMSIPPEALEIDTKSTYRLHIQDIDKETLIAGTRGLLTTEGYTASEKKINIEAGVSGTDEDNRLSYDGETVTYKDVVMTERVFGEEIEKTYETFTLDTPQIGKAKTGYGFKVNRSAYYENQAGAYFSDIDEKANIHLSTRYDSAFVEEDNLDDFVEVSDGVAEKMLIQNVTDVSDGSDGSVEKTYDFHLPNVYMEEETGRVFSDMNTYTENRLLDAGQKLYIPVWLDSLGEYDVDIVAEKPIGVHGVTLHVNGYVDVHAYMFSHSDSDTPEKDELLIHPMDQKEIPENW